MKNYLIVFLLTALCSHISYCQDLIYNGDFEEYTKCVNEYGELEVSRGWFQLNGSSDYYNSCNTQKKFVGVPNNYGGFQNPHSGNGYAGFYLFSFNTMDEKRGIYNREYLHTKLISPLEKNIKYVIEFYYSLADESQFYTNKFSVCLSKNKDARKRTLMSRCLVCDRSTIQTVPAISATDTVNWHKVEFEFTSGGGEEYLIIGLFDKDLSFSEFNKLVKKKRMTHNEFESSCYYYIDDVSVVRMDKKKEFSHRKN